MSSRIRRFATSFLSAALLSAGTSLIADNGLLLHWDFDKLDKKVHDSSGNGNDGIIKNDVTEVTGIEGNAIKLDGRYTPAVQCDDAEGKLNPKTALTVEFWIYPFSSYTRRGSAVLKKGWAEGWGINTHYNANQIWFCAKEKNQRQDYVFPGASPKIGEWSHVAVTFDGKEGIVKIYLNGRSGTKSADPEKQSVALKHSVVKNSVIDSGTIPLIIDSMGDEFAIDEVKIYNRTLSEEEIAKSFRAYSEKRKIQPKEIKKIYPALNYDRSCENLRIDGKDFISNRQADSIIAVDENAGTITYHAAQELQYYLEKCFSARIPIVKVNKKNLAALDGKNLILVGSSPATEKLGINQYPETPDEFHVFSKDGNLFILGKDDMSKDGFSNDPAIVFAAGTVYGVYSFLESMGFRWYFPDAAGEVLPDQKDIAVQKLDISGKPYFKHRMAIPVKNASPWLRKAGFGGAIHPAKNSHTFNPWIKNPEFLKAHPGVLGLKKDGSRYDNNTFCFSSPETEQEVFKESRKYFQTMPFPQYPDFCILQTDGMKPCCACPECSKKYRPQEGTYGSQSDLVAGFAIKMASLIKDEFPERRIVIGAYNQTNLPPVTIRELPSNVSVHIAKTCLYLWTEKERDLFYNETLRGWLKLKPATVSFWEYYDHVSWGNGRWQGVPCMAPHLIAYDKKKLKELSEETGIPFLGERVFGIDSRSPEEIHNYWNIPNLYITARLLWDPGLSPDEILEDFYKKFFGPAEKPMAEFYKQIIDVSESGKWGQNLKYCRGMTKEEIGKSHFFGKNPWEELFTKDVLAKLNEKLQEAETLAVESPYKERIAMIREQFDFTLSQAKKHQNTKASEADVKNALEVN